MARQDASLDPAVQAILGDQELRARKAETPEERRAVRKAKDRQEVRLRVTLELHPDVVATLRRAAELEGCSPAAACNFLLGHALLQYGAGSLDLAGAKQETDSNRWGYVVDLGDLVPELRKLLKRL